jgi:hypothetical protein
MINVALRTIWDSIDRFDRRITANAAIATVETSGVAATADAAKAAADIPATYKTTVSVDAGDYSVDDSVEIVHVVYSPTGKTLVTLAPSDGRHLVIKDAGFNATLNPITVRDKSGGLINGDIEWVINGDGDWIALYCYGGNWFIVG